MARNDDDEHWRLQQDLADKGSAYKVWARIEGRLTTEERADKASALRAYEVAQRAIDRYRARQKRSNATTAANGNGGPAATRSIEGEPYILKSSHVLRDVADATAARCRRGGCPCRVVQSGGKYHVYSLKLSKCEVEARKTRDKLSTARKRKKGSSKRGVRSRGKR